MCWRKSLFSYTYMITCGCTFLKEVNNGNDHHKIFSQVVYYLLFPPSLIQHLLHQFCHLSNIFLLKNVKRYENLR